MYSAVFWYSRLFPPVLIVTVVTTLLLYHRPFNNSSMIADTIRRQSVRADLIARCTAVKNFYGSATPESPINASKVVEEMKPVCNRTFYVDSLDVLRACGHQPVLITRTKSNANKTDNKQAFLVPDVVHFIYNYATPMTFLMYLSVLSVQRFIHPQYVIIYGPSLPFGDWWNRTAAEVDNIYFVNVTSKLPTHIYGKRIKHLAHVSDMFRLSIVYAIGGIYLDLDILTFRSFDGLRNYPFTLAREASWNVNSGIQISQPCPQFILHWIDNWRDFDPNEWSTHSVVLTHSLATGKYSHLINVEDGTLIGPKNGQVSELYKDGVKFNWAHQYSTHIWQYRSYFVRIPQSPDEIKQLNSTIGQMMRYVYTGRRD